MLFLLLDHAEDFIRNSVNCLHYFCYARNENATKHFYLYKSMIKNVQQFYIIILLKYISTSISISTIKRFLWQMEKQTFEWWCTCTIATLPFLSISSILFKIEEKCSQYEIFTGPKLISLWNSLSRPVSGKYACLQASYSFAKKLPFGKRFEKQERRQSAQAIHSTRGMEKGKP